MKKQLVTFVGGLILLSACTKESKDPMSIHFTRDDFKQRKELKNPETIRLEDTYNDPLAFYLIQDSLVLVNNQSHSDHLIEVFSLRTGQRILPLAPKGNGPGEFTSGYCICPSNQQQVFHIQDQNTHTYYTVDLNQTLKDRSLAIRTKFQYSAEVHPYTDVYPVDDTHYLGYHTWYLEDSTYNNNVAPFLLYSVTESGQGSEDLMECMKKYNYFVSDVNGGKLFVLPDKHIWLADMHRDKITIYDHSLHPVKSLIGPDNYQLAYEERKTNIPMPFIVFKNEKDYLSYSSWTLTDKALYIIYIGLNGGKYDPENLQPVEVFKFDLKGNPVCDYKLDRFVYKISIDSKEEYLYATTRKSFKDAAEFVRYKL